MNNRFNFSIKKLILLLLAFCFLAVLIYVAFLYRYIDHSIVDNEADVIHFVKEASVIDEVTDLDYFAEKELYNIIYGYDAKGKQYIAYNPKNNRKKDKLTIVKLDDVLSKEEIEKNWQSSCDGCTLKKSGPAMLEDQALWELTYMDQKDRYVMEYIALKDGSTYEKLHLNQKYR